MKSANAGAKTIPVEITVAGDALSDRGDSETWRHSRLRWLNSTRGIADAPVKPFAPVKRQGKTLLLTGKEVTIGAGGLPSSMKVRGREILARPMMFKVKRPSCSALTPLPSGTSFSLMNPIRLPR